MAACYLPFQHTQTSSTKCHSLLPSRLPMSCSVVCADSAYLLATALSISHTDVPHTTQRKKRQRLNRYVMEGNLAMAKSRGKRITSNLW